MKIVSHFAAAALVLSALIFNSSCDKKSGDTNANTTAEPAQNDDMISTDVVENTTEITFEQDRFDFGEIKAGVKVNHEFKFTNTGKNDLIITEARKTCGCTVTDWPKDPIKPGDSNVIKIQYNSEGRSGAINKTITVVANTRPSETKLYIQGTVIKSN